MDPSQLLQAARDALGVGEPSLSTGEMLLRELVVFPLAVLMVRGGAKRFLAELSPMDLIVAVMLGSIVSRAISGNAPFVPSVAAGFALVLIHRGGAMLATRWHTLAVFLKGESRLLVREGEALEEEMRSAGIGRDDLLAALRRNAHLERLEDVKLAYLERTGDISIIPWDRDGS